MTERLVWMMPLAFVAACGGDQKVEQAPAEIARPVKIITVGSAGRSAGLTSLPGRVAAADELELSFRVGGPMVDLSAREGDVVKAGQELGRLDPRDFDIRLRSARARLQQAAADFRRLARLYEKDAISEAQLDQARAARDIADAAVEDARAGLADTSLRAPFAGVIGKRHAENFQDVRPKQPILTLVRLDRLDEVDIVVDVP